MEGERERERKKVTLKENSRGRILIFPFKWIRFKLRSAWLNIDILPGWMLLWYSLSKCTWNWVNRQERKRGREEWKATLTSLWHRHALITQVNLVTVIQLTWVFVLQFWLLAIWICNCIRAREKKDEDECNIQPQWMMQDGCSWSCFLICLFLALSPSFTWTCILLASFDERGKSKWEAKSNFDEATCLMQVKANAVKRERI